jgi:hypothetical protein
MENGTVQKGQNLLEDFVWPIDTGRLMGDTGRLMGDPSYSEPIQDEERTSLVRVSGQGGIMLQQKVETRKR